MFDFNEAPDVSGLYRAKYNGYSIIYGTHIHGYEIMDPDGEVQSGFTLEQAEDFVRKGKFVNA